MRPLQGKPPWYQTAFLDEYSELYAHRDRAEADRAVKMIGERIGLREAMRVLDLACGPGRHLAMIAERVGPGMATGLDLSRVMLGQADRLRRGEEAGGTIDFGLIRGDMRFIPFRASRFDAVVNLFTSFGYFEDEAQNRRVLDEVARVLRPGGNFVIDLINRGWLEQSFKPASERRLSSGARVTETREFGPGSPRVIKRVTWDDPERGRIQWTESVRVYAPQEMAALLADAGFEVIDRRGDYDGNEWTAGSSRLILFARRRSEPGA